MKYLNNVVEADHGKLKLLIRPVRGFKTLNTTYAIVIGLSIESGRQRLCFAPASTDKDGEYGHAHDLNRVGTVHFSRIDARVSRVRGYLPRYRTSATHQQCCVGPARLAAG